MSPRPLEDGLFTWPVPAGGPRLLGSRCPSCAEVFFPRQGQCSACFREGTEEIRLGPHGTLYSHTVVRFRTPAYAGPVPYAVGFVELPEGIRVIAKVNADPLENLRVGQPLRLDLETLYTDETGAEVVNFCFTTGPPSAPATRETEVWRSQSGRHPGGEP